PDRVPARLRHAARACPGAGLRRVAEQPAPAAGGLRHLGHEAGAERRAQNVEKGGAEGPVGYLRERQDDSAGRRGGGPPPPGAAGARTARTSWRRPRGTRWSRPWWRRSSTTPAATAWPLGGWRWWRTPSGRWGRGSRHRGWSVTM